MEDSPWVTYSKAARLTSGFTHPLGQQELRQALDAAGVQVGQLHLSDALPDAWKAQQPVRLVTARRIGDDAFRRYGWQPTRQTELTISACPRSVRPAVRDALVREVLDEVLLWLKAVPGRGEGWAASERQIEALWLHPGVRYAQDRWRG